MAATFGTVTDGDLAAAGTLQHLHGKGHMYYYRDRSGTQLPALLQLSKTAEPRLVCSITSEVQVNSSSIRISNRLGKSLQSVLNTMEWVVGLFYDIHFPTTLEATAKQVRDPNFGQQNLDLLKADYTKMVHAAMSNPSCSAAVLGLLRNDENALVCPVNWFWRLPHQPELVVVGVFPLCVVLPGATQPRLSGRDNLREVWGLTPLLTKIKISLGILHVEVEHKDGQ